MKQHQHIWEDLTPDQQQLYQAQAMARAHKKSFELDEELRTELAHIRLQRPRLGSEALGEGMNVGALAGQLKQADYEAILL